MCIRPAPEEKMQPERPQLVPAQFGQRQLLVNQQQRQQPRNYLDHLTKIQFRCDNEHNNLQRHWLSAAIEQKMFAVFASLFECSFFLTATISALFSIIRPKMRNSLNKIFLIALPLMALMPALGVAAEQEGQQQQQQEKQLQQPVDQQSSLN